MGARPRHPHLIWYDRFRFHNPTIPTMDPFNLILLRTTLHLFFLTRQEQAWREQDNYFLLFVLCFQNQHMVCDFYSIDCWGDSHGTCSLRFTLNEMIWQFVLMLTGLSFLIKFLFCLNSMLLHFKLTANPTSCRWNNKSKDDRHNDLINRLIVSGRWEFIGHPMCSLFQVDEMPTSQTFDQTWMIAWMV